MSDNAVLDRIIYHYFPLFITILCAVHPQQDIIDHINQYDADIVITCCENMSAFGGINEVYFLRCEQSDREFILASCNKDIYLYLWNKSDCNSRWLKKNITYTKSFDTLYIGQHKLDKIKSILSIFGKNKQYYEEKGVPYKLTFLLQGRPGTGKTSFIKALSKEIGGSVFIMNFDGKRFENHCFRSV